MTDESNGQSDDRGTATNECTTHGPVPEGAEWDLAAQEPYDETGELTTAIVYAVAEAEEISPRDVKNPPLYEVVDTDALEAAYLGAREQTPDRDTYCSTEFMYRGLRVVVRNNGWVLVHERVDS